ncbi:hypothetical protein [Rhizorhabdus sp. FW153]|uniref:hypothetical protein n=1 Tax=Rhizorhabdus sp. FW153 TaxID=3400216 RepID=UPI003CE85242
MSAERLILAFDGWTEGLPHYARLVPALRARGYRLMLIHLGSWGHDMDQPVEVERDGVLVRDIRYYGRRSFGAILRQERPACLLFLSTRAFAHQAMIRHARRLDIPTLHLFHGIYCAAPPMMEEVNFEVSPWNDLRLYAGKLYRNLRHIMPRYLGALATTARGSADWIEFGRELRSRLTGGTGAALPSDVRTTAGCVYVKGDMAEMRQYHLPDDRIFAVGNPDFMQFGLQANDLGSRLGRPGNGEIVYIETGLLAYAIRFTSREDYIAHLDSIAAAIARHGYRLAVKPHPASVRSGLSVAIAEAGYRVYDNGDFVDGLRAASGAMTEPSSAGAVPAMLGLPLFLISCGKLTGRGHGRLFTRYPGSVPVETIERLDGIAADIEKPIDPVAHRAWLDEFAEPLPASAMPDRVADILQGLDRRAIS